MNGNFTILGLEGVIRFDEMMQRRAENVYC